MQKVPFHKVKLPDCCMFIDGIDVPESSQKGLVFLVRFGCCFLMFV